MKISFIYCPYGPEFNSFGKAYWTSQIHPGLCSIGAYVKSKGYKDIALIDTRKLKGWQDFKGAIKREKPVVAGITMMSCSFGNATKAAGIIKEVNPDTIIVVGGAHPTVATEEVASDQNFDHIIVGEGEISFTRLLDDIRHNRPRKRIIKGIMPNLDELPFGDREMFDYKSVTNFASNFLGIFKPPSIAMMISRGCPFDCTFCAPHSKIMFGPKIRYRSIDNVIEELKLLGDRYNFRSLFFFDSSVNLNEKWIREFAEKYKENGFKANISVNGRADTICRNEKGIKMLSDIGLKMVHIGYESGSQRMLDFVKKGTTVEQYIEATEICKKYGIIIRGLFMFGLPTETKEDVQATLNLIRKIKPDVCSFSYFTPVPGCELYGYCKERNLSLIKSHNELADYRAFRARIKGIDYDYLRCAVGEGFGFQFHSRVIGKFMRFVYAYSKSEKVRSFFMRLYSEWVVLKKAFDKQKKRFRKYTGRE